MKESDTWMKKKSIAYFKIWRVTNIGLDLPNFSFDQNWSITSLLVTDVGNLLVTVLVIKINYLFTLASVTNNVGPTSKRCHQHRSSVTSIHKSSPTSHWSFHRNLDVSYPQKLRINSTFIMCLKTGWFDVF